jgi:hypothetical protein
MWSTALVQFWSITLDPTKDRGVIDVQLSFEHHLLQITIAERRAHIPAYAQQHDLGFKMAPFERGLLDHGEKLLCSAPNKEAFIITPSSLQHSLSNWQLRYLTVKTTCLKNRRELVRSDHARYFAAGDSNLNSTPEKRHRKSAPRSLN